MLVKTKAVVISSLKFQEKSLIVKCFTLSDGLKSYFIRDAFSSRKGNQKIAYFQPLTIIEIEAVHKNKGTLEQLKEIKINSHFRSIHTNIIKSTIALFLSEMLNHSIREEEKNESLFLFLEHSLQWFDEHQDVADFHLIFLLEMTKHLGFYPDISDLQYPFFDTQSGVFVSHQNRTTLQEHDSQLFKKLIELSFEANQKTFHINERQTLLQVLVDYYARHLEGFVKPKSLEVLRTVFS